MANETELERLVVRLMGDGTSYQKMLQEAQQTTTQLEKTVARLGIAEKEYQAVSERTASIVADANRITAGTITESERYGDTINNLNRHLAAGRITQETWNRAIVQAEAAIAKAIPPVVTWQQSLQNFNATQRQSSAAVAEARRITESVITPSERYGNTVNSLNSHLSNGRITQETWNRAITQAENELKSVISPTIEWGRVLQSTGGALRSFGMSWSLYITAPIAGFLGASVMAGISMDSLRRSLDSVTGSASETQFQLNSLREIAKLPGIGFQEAIEGSVRLQAAGFSARMAERSLMAFGNALASVGRGKAELAMVNRALTQIAGKGKVMAQEINQVAEHLPQIRKAMIGAFGTANTEVIQEMNLTSTQFIEAIIKELEKLPKVTSGAKVELEILADSAFIAFSKVGAVVLEMLIPVVKLASSTLDTLGDTFANIPRPVQYFMIGVLGLTAAIGPLIFGLGTITIMAGQVVTAYTALTASTVSLTAAQVAMGIGVTALKFGLAGLAIAGVGLLTWQIYQSIPAIRQFNDAMRESAMLTQALLDKEMIRHNRVIKAAADSFSGKQRKTLLEDELKTLEKTSDSLVKRLEDTKQRLEEVLPKGRLSHWAWEGAEEKKAIAELEQRIPAIKKQIEETKEVLGALKDANTQGGTATPETMKSAEDYANSLRLQAETFGMVSREAKIAEFSLLGVGAATLNAMLAEDARLTTLEDNKKKTEELKKATDELVQSLLEEIAAIGITAEQLKINKLATLGADEATKSYIESLVKLRTEAKVLDDINTFNQKLREQIDTFGMTSEEIERYKLAGRGASDEMLALSDALIAQKVALDAQKKAMEEGKTITEKYLTHQQKLVAEYTKLLDLLARGAIGQETFDKALTDAREEMVKTQAEADIKLKFSVEGNDLVRAGTKEFRQLLRDVEERNLTKKLTKEAEALTTPADTTLTATEIPDPETFLADAGTLPISFDPEGTVATNWMASDETDSTLDEKGPKQKDFTATSVFEDREAVGFLERIADGIDAMLDREEVILKPMSSLGT